MQEYEAKEPGQLACKLRMVLDLLMARAALTPEQHALLLEVLEDAGPDHQVHNSNGCAPHLSMIGTYRQRSF